MTTSEKFAFQVKLNLPYEEAIARVTAALKEEGFGVLTEIDVKATLKQKLDVEFRKYVILGACNPHLAHRALTLDLGIGLLLPCNVIVYEDVDEKGAETAAGKQTHTVIAIMDPAAMMDVTGNDALKPVATEARACIERVSAALVA